MTRSELEHAIRAACDVARDTEPWVFGSQAILGEYPDAPGALRASAECDVCPRNNPEAVDEIDGALGELSDFHRSFGFYVHGLSVEAATLPRGWKGRTVTVRNGNTRGNAGRCVEAHDLAVSKLVAYREKDKEFVRVLLNENLIDAGTLKRRIADLDIGPDTKERLALWVELTAADRTESTDPSS